MTTSRRVVVIDVVGLNLRHFNHPDKMPHITALGAEGSMQPMRPVFPAVSRTVQASLTTGVLPEAHGIVSSGFYFPGSYRVAFSEQAASLVEAPRIWQRLRAEKPSLKAAAVFTHNTLYGDLDAIIIPKPLYAGDHTIEWCYSKPEGLYEDIAYAIGPFRRDTYWGPAASIDSTRWIVGATLEVMARTAPDLLFVCLPHLDLCSRKAGPGADAVLDEVQVVDAEVGRLVEGIRGMNLPGETVFVLLSEFAFHEVWGDIPLNRKLRDLGFLTTRLIHAREYVDLELSPAFAMVDHQVAHVYVQPEYQRRVRNALESIDGIDLLIDRKKAGSYGIGHGRSGDLVAVSAEDRWFSYYWWDEPDLAPSFAGNVNDRQKPGFDPLELFVDPVTMRVSQNTKLIRGSHGHPPVCDHDCVPLVISGTSSGLHVREGVSVTDVAGIVERLLLQ